MPRQLRFGQRPSRFRFALNSHSDYRASRCNGLTRYARASSLCSSTWSPTSCARWASCASYCSKCEFIIAHQDELEAELAAHFEQTRPDVIGNDYLLIATVRLPAWREGLWRLKTLDQVLAHAADFKEYLEVEYTPGGWYPADEKAARGSRRRSQQQARPRQ